jgi:AcrR family transcriptional regulator
VSTRDRIVAAAARLYGRYGYNGIGLKQVAAESGSPIGSLYHFFPGGKDELAAEALRMSGAGYQLLVEGILENAPDLESAIRISFVAAAEVVAASDYADACWIETVALEVASTNEPLRLVTAEIFDGWIEAATGWMEGHGVPADRARALGIAYITGLEGAFVLSRALRSPEPLHATGEMLVAAAREVMAASGSAPRVESRPSTTKGARR